MFTLIFDKIKRQINAKKYCKCYASRSIKVKVRIAMFVTCSIIEEVAYSK